MRGGCSDGFLMLVSTPLVIGLIWWMPEIGWFALGVIVLAVIVAWREPLPPELIERERRRLIARERQRQIQREQWRRVWRR